MGIAKRRFGRGGRGVSPASNDGMSRGEEDYASFQLYGAAAIAAATTAATTKSSMHTTIEAITYYCTF